MDNQPEIFVFGSNLAGRHGKGAALTAVQKYGAEYGVGIGLTGRAYAIPTKDRVLRTLPLGVIRPYVLDFLNFAYSFPAMLFKITRIGCGLAGYQNEQMAPMFRGASENCLFDKDWEPWLPGARFWNLVSRNR